MKLPGTPAGISRNGTAGDGTAGSGAAGGDSAPADTAARVPSVKFATSAAYLGSVLSTVPDAMVVIDSNGLILSFSATAVRMFGYSEQELLGHNVAMLMPAPDRAAHDGYIARYLRTGEAHIIGIGRVLVARRRDASTFPIELSIGEAVTPAGRIFTGFVRDLTERRATERRLQDLQAELSRISRISAMGSLAAALAHELNQPLTAITNYLEAARDLIEAGEVDVSALIREAVVEAAGQSIRAGQIVRRLRDFITRGDSEKAIEPLDTLIAEATALALTGLGGRAVEISSTVAPRAALIFADRIQIQQVLFNLLRNALEAGAQQSLLRIAVTADVVPDAMVQVSVADNGPGLDADAAAHLFEPFRSTRPEGMGLGLSICRNIVEAQGGRIWFDAVRGGGSVFHFTVMAAHSEAVDGD